MMITFMRCQVFMMAVPLFKRSLHRMHQILRSHIIGPNFDFDENHETSFLNCHCEHYIFVKSSLLPCCRFNFEQDCRTEQLLTMLTNGADDFHFLCC